MNEKLKLASEMAEIACSVGAYTNAVGNLRRAIAAGNDSAIGQRCMLVADTLARERVIPDGPEWSAAKDRVGTILNKLESLGCKMHPVN